MLTGQTGVMIVVLNVLLDQIGIPVPGAPTLIVAGAVAATGAMPPFELALGCLIASLVADSVWYVAGRIYGNRVMKTLCRVSLTPDSCVSQTQLRFERWGAGALVAAKFVPGLGLLAPPLAGALRMTASRFLAVSTLGAALWVGGFLGLGALFRVQIALLMPLVGRLGGYLFALLALLLAGYLGWKWWERRRFYRLLRMARIEVPDLYRMMDAGNAPLILDVRSPTARALEPRRIPGAVNVSLHDIGPAITELPRDREVVVYCTCPNEASAALVARALHRHGFSRVRPLRGGLEEWIRAGYAIETSPPSGSG